MRQSIDAEGDTTVRKHNQHPTPAQIETFAADESTFGPRKMREELEPELSNHLSGCEDCWPALDAARLKVAEEDKSSLLQPGQASDVDRKLTDPAWGDYLLETAPPLSEE
jgi:hypothetical protein